MRFARKGKGVVIPASCRFCRGHSLAGASQPSKAQMREWHRSRLSTTFQPARPASHASGALCVVGCMVSARGNEEPIDEVYNLCIAVVGIVDRRRAVSRGRHTRNVSVVNETGYAIKFLGFNGPDDGLDEWDNELEGNLENQAQTYVEFNEQDEGCAWNI